MITANQSKTFNFYLRFTDLCAFTPNKENTRMRVLFPKCKSPVKASNGDPIQAHFPVVVFSAADHRKHEEPDQADEQPLYQIHQYGSGEESVGLWFLQDQDLEIFTEPPAPFSYKFEEQNTADMSMIQPGHGGLNDACLAEGADVEDYLSARMLVDSGTLEVKKLAKDPNGAVISWEFRSTAEEPPISETRSLAVQYELAIPNVEHVEIVARPFGDLDPDSRESLVLASSRDDLIVEIKNEPPEEILRLDWTIEEEEAKRAKHFEKFYDLCANGDVLKRIPYIGGSTITSDTLHCPPALFPPHADA